jgi:uncharacterized damage-inducible protein DinB
MYRKIDDFVRDWSYDVETTTKLFGNLTDASLGQKVSEDGRTLGFLAWHIVVTMGEMPGHVGLKIDAPAEDAPVPDRAAAIADAFARTAASLKDAVVSNWTDETLLVEDDMYGDLWKRGQTLLYLIFHQAHHRGQMTVLMRQAGLPVVGIYGPAKEEWAAMGMPAMP